MMKLVGASLCGLWNINILIMIGFLKVEFQWIFTLIFNIFFQEVLCLQGPHDVAGQTL